MKIIRANNIPATTLLCFSGGFIMNPRFFSIIKNVQLWIAVITTNLIMSASMVINDIYDMEIDRINSPHRPLITGEVSKKVAIGLTVCLIGCAEIISILFLKRGLQNIVHFSVLFVLLYTPFLKRIIFIKNLSCATIVAFSLFFTGLTSFRGENILDDVRFSVLKMVCSLIFCGSFTNEIILDIRDIEGDSSQGIKTVPVIFGKNMSFLICYIFWYFTILMNVYNLAISQSVIVCGVLCMILNPQLGYLYDVFRKNATKDAIKHYLNRSNRTLVLILFYLCGISYKMK